MVMLACYESLVVRHCDLFKFTVDELLLKAKMKLHSLHVSCDEPDPGVLQTLGFSTGLLLATINIHMQCAVLLWVCYTLKWCLLIPEIQC